MANAMYAAGRQNFGDGNISFSSHTMKVVACDHADDNPDVAVDNALDDIAGAARVATSPALASKTNVGGTLDAADVTISAVTGDQFESFSLYKDSGTESTSYLIAKWDTATGLPFTPDGTDLLIIWGVKILTL